MPYSIVHVLVGLKFNKSRWHTLGCLFPDITHLLIEDPSHDLMKKFIRLLDKKKYSDFIEGIKNHAALDNYFHKKYVYVKRNILAKEFNLSKLTAEGYIEMALDLNYKKKFRYINKEINESSKLLDVDLMTDLLSKIIKVDKSIIRNALKDSKKIASFNNMYTFRRGISNFLILRKYKRLNVHEFNIFKFFKILNRAKELIKDEEKELKIAIGKVKSLKKNPWIIKFI